MEQKSFDKSLQEEINQLKQQLTKDNYQQKSKSQKIQNKKFRSQTYIEENFLKQKNPLIAKFDDFNLNIIGETELEKTIKSLYPTFNEIQKLQQSTSINKTQDGTIQKLSLEQTLNKPIFKSQQDQKNELYQKQKVPQVKQQQKFYTDSQEIQYSQQKLLKLNRTASSQNYTFHKSNNITMTRNISDNNIQDYDGRPLITIEVDQKNNLKEDQNKNQKSIKYKRDNRSLLDQQIEQAEKIVTRYMHDHNVKKNIDDKVDQINKVIKKHVLNWQPKQLNQKIISKIDNNNNLENYLIRQPFKVPPSIMMMRAEYELSKQQFQEIKGDSNAQNDEIEDYIKPIDLSREMKEYEERQQTQEDEPSNQQQKLDIPLSNLQETTNSQNFRTLPNIQTFKNTNQQSLSNNRIDSFLQKQSENQEQEQHNQKQQQTTGQTKKRKFIYKPEQNQVKEEDKMPQIIDEEELKRRNLKQSFIQTRELEKIKMQQTERDYIKKIQKHRSKSSSQFGAPNILQSIKKNSNLEQSVVQFLIPFLNVEQYQKVLRKSYIKNEPIVRQVTKNLYEDAQQKLLPSLQIKNQKNQDFQKFQNLINTCQTYSTKLGVDLKDIKEKQFHFHEDVNQYIKRLKPESQRMYENDIKEIQNTQNLHNYLKQQIEKAINQQSQNIDDEIPDYITSYIEQYQLSTQVTNPLLYNQLLFQANQQKLKKNKILNSCYSRQQEKELGKYVKFSDFVGFS